MTANSARFPRRGFLTLAGAGAAGVAGLASTPAEAVDNQRIDLAGPDGRVRWIRDAGGWTTESIQVRTPSGWRTVFTPAGGYGVLNSTAATPPDREAVRRAEVGQLIELRARVASTDGDTARFRCEHPRGSLTATWRVDAAHGDLLVTLAWTPRRAGWYSLPSPTLATVADADLAWGVLPGYWSTSTLAENAEHSSRYNIGLPDMPLLAEERSTTSLVAAVQSAADAATLAVVAEPDLARDPWPDDSTNQNAWHVASSLRSWNAALSPTLFSPVLGQHGSWREAGETVSVTFRYVLTPGAWHEVTEHVMQNVYPIGGYLELARAQDSLSHRINRMHDFLVTPDSRWHTWTYDGRTLGAESGKLSDVGAMWMMTRLTADPVFEHERLPYARNFKLGQQDTSGGVFHGAALGEYFRDGAWISEIVWANREGTYGPDYVSPMFTTFYTLADGGNIALFDPDDDEIRDRIRLGAERLLDWQHDDGSFDIGYLRDDPSTTKYPDLPDLRATWYGFVPAYRILGDERYLDAARRGADWYIENAVRTGNFIGVCDDTGLIRDFQVIFSAQALLDLHELTGDDRYREAAIQAATFYTLHMYDHPVATDRPKTFNDKTVEDWQLSQVGMPYEHAGFHGSVNRSGPITLTSHAGAFVRFHQLTGRQIFLDLARAAARGRDEFVGETSGIPSYYWRYGNGGSSVFPWHGWWHIGWLMDYLIAEAELRTAGAITFPAGFCTAKVGSHRPYGFAPGTIFGHSAELWMPRPLVSVDDPEVDWLSARSADGGRLFLVALNQSSSGRSATVRLDPRGLVPGQRASWGETEVLTGSAAAAGDHEWSVDLDGHGVAVLAIETTLSPDPEGPALREFTVTGDETALEVRWSYWASVTTWAEWRVDDGEWARTPQQEGFALTAAIDLTAISAPATVQVRIAAEQPNGLSYSQPVERRIHRLGANIALGRPVEVSSTYAPEYVGENLVDGNTTDTSSRWLSALDDSRPTATFSLAQPTTPKLLRMHTGKLDRQCVVSWIVQARAADGTWTEVGSVTGNTEVRRDTPLTPVTTDEVRLIVTDRSRDSIDVARIFEVEIYDDVEW